MQNATHKCKRHSLNLFGMHFEFIQLQYSSILKNVNFAKRPMWGIQNKMDTHE